MPVHGKPIAPKRKHACRMCGRAIGALGRLPVVGWPLCTQDYCEVATLAQVHALFPTPYGAAVHPNILAVFTKLLDTGGRIFVQIRPITERASVLADAYVDLLAWQKAYDTYEWCSNPQGYDEGRVQLVPPRRIDEVLALRTLGAPVRIDPTRNLTEDIRITLHTIRRDGAAGYSIPF